MLGEEVWGLVSVCVHSIAVKWGWGQDTWGSVLQPYTELGLCTEALGLCFLVHPLKPSFTTGILHFATAVWGRALYGYEGQVSTYFLWHSSVLCSFGSENDGFVMDVFNEKSSSLLADQTPDGDAM